MVFVYPNTLQISPANPYNIDSLTLSAWIGFDLGNIACPYGVDLGRTRTYIHLLVRNVDEQQSWVNATHVATYDCYTQCCLDSMNMSSVPNNPGSEGWHITFDTINAFPIGHYEFMAVDDQDYNNTNYAANRVAKLSVEVIPNPTCTETPCLYGCPDSVACGKCGNPACETTCTEGDIICELLSGKYSQYLPIILIGAVALVFIMSKPKGKHKE